MGRLPERQPGSTTRRAVALNQLDIAILGDSCPRLLRAGIARSRLIRERVAATLNLGMAAMVRC